MLEADCVGDAPHHACYILEPQKTGGITHTPPPAQMMHLPAVSTMQSLGRTSSSSTELGASVCNPEVGETKQQLDC